ncbi:MAG: hypothetical protein LLG16_03060 [Euryarchaeota archaeon]|nr:hypothetical protein [Euryarchaeota archaeon]
MVTKESKPKARSSTAAKKVEPKAPVKVTRSTPIKVLNRDRSPRELGIEILARFYMGEMDLDMVKRRALRYEGRTIGDDEAVLMLLSDMIRNAEDHQLKARLMEAIAEFYSILGQDPRRVLAEMHKTELGIFKEIGFEHVTISCKDGACPACRKHDGAKLSVEEALALMPLPHAACTRKVHSKAAPFCRCKYFGEFVG